MSETGRITAWLIPSILVWGGCAAPVLVQPSVSVDEPGVERTETATAGDVDQLPPMVVAEAALIRETALRRGYSAAESQRFEESLLHARPEDRQFLTRFIYAQLNRQDNPSSVTNESAAAPPESALSGPDAAHVVSRAAGGSPDPGESSRVMTTGRANRSRQSVDEAASGGLVSNAASEQTRGSVVDTGSDVEASRPALPDGPNRQASSTANDDQNLVDATDNSRSDDEISWQQQLRRTITGLRRQLAADEELDALEESRLRICQGLLQLAAEDPEQAMESLEGLDEEELEFWRRTIMGLNILTNAEDVPKRRYRVESATEHLQSGLDVIATLGPLRVNNLAFAGNVRSFGVYEEIGSNGFEPGEEIILYVEIANFASEEVAVDKRELGSSRRRQSTADEIPMYETELVARYDILDQNQRVIVSRTLPATLDRCRQRRRDFFIAYPLFLPKEISKGYYTLELTIEDRKGGKFGNGTIDLRIR